MKQLGLQAFTDTYLTSFGLVIFFTFFVCVLLWVFRKNSKHHYGDMEKMPLMDEEFSNARPK
ncbi:cbb3-type cytochrome oxidase subunit 3 [Bdellovibrio sp. HCB288]|uniref:cbb3-type cytochrome oxidase subunit 3 n=1 Tax=Bdellovibrio sp. HCB288 TaxID=3394355 RepID=UPI0039B55521